MSDVRKSLRLLTKMSDHEQIAQVAHQKLVNERIVFFLANRSFAHFFAKNERFAQKTDERIPSPGLKKKKCHLTAPLPYCMYSILESTRLRDF